MNWYKLRLFVILVFGSSCSLSVAGVNKGKTSPQGKSTVDSHRALLNINNISMWASDDGTLEKNKLTGTGGVSYPKGTVNAVFAGGLMWGGIIRDGVTTAFRVGGQNYVTGTVPGRIISKGVREKPTNSDVHIYRIRRDWRTADLRQDAADMLGISLGDVTDQDIADLRDRYAQDWLTWPAQYGAPYYNLNGVAGYQADTSAGANSDEPGLAGADQVIWMVCNDLDSSVVNSTMGTRPMGLEEQITCWAYANRPGLQNVIFQRYRLIYKGITGSIPSARIDSMFIGKWSDPDIGANLDDYAGYNQDGGFGYVYNSSAVDAQYSVKGLVPPVIGYNLIEGPRVRRTGGKAHWDLRTIPNYVNLSPTSFTIFSTDSLEVDPTQASQPRVGQWYNILNGYRPRPTNIATCYQNPYSGECSKFVLTGDPRTRRGWVDGKENLAGDRRIVIASGPFQMSLGDSQEVIIALMGATGKDNVDGITSMGAINQAAHDDYDIDFRIPQSPPQPDLRVVELDKTFILDWESDTTATRMVEQYSSQGYKFNTYTIYQYSDTTVTSGRAAFPAFYIGDPRSLNVTTDLLRNKPLVNGEQYYYSVCAVMFNPDPFLKNQFVESAPLIRTATPHTPNPGVIYPYVVGDTIKNIQNLVGINDSPVNVVYDDPTKADGDTYEIAYRRVSFLVAPTWNLIAQNHGDTLLSNCKIDTRRRVVSRGFTIGVGTPHYGVKGVFLTMYKNQPAQEPIFNRANSAGDLMIVGAGFSLLDTISGGTANDADIEWRFTGDSSWALLIKTSYQKSKWIRVPYTFWQIDRTGATSNGRQIWSYITGSGKDSAWHPAVLLPRSYNGAALRTFYPVTAYADSQLFAGKFYGNIYYDDILTNPDGNTIKAVLYASSTRSKGDSKTTIHHAYIADLDTDGVAVPIGTIIRMRKYKDVFDGDAKLFRPAPVISNDPDAARSAIERINAFPNPYYGANRAERSRTGKFIRFNHLPPVVTIRIFNLAGVLVKTIYKDDASQFADWNLQNETGLAVASGIYLANMELRDAMNLDLGTKTLKLMIVQEDQFLHQ